MSIISDIATYLETNGLGTVGTDIFQSFLPSGVNAGLAVLDTGGLQPDPYLPTKEPTFQVFVRSASYSTGRSKLDSVRSTLHQLKNTTIGSNYFYFILAQSEGGHLGRDEAGRDTFSMNFHCRVR